VWSSRATRLVVDLFAAPRGERERLRLTLARDDKTSIWSAEAPLATLRAAGLDTVYYGLRAWGPNWPYDAAWTAGSEIGFVADVSDQGDRFNPNKLLYDPYALELSHDPFSPAPFDGSVYEIGPGRRARDSSLVAPKGIVLLAAKGDVGPKPPRALASDVIYEVQVRGLTMRDPSVPEAERGTFAGAARKAAYLRDLGVTAIELLPIQETQNDQNDASPGSQNYWGYATLGYFAPDRRFSSDRTPGGPTRELRQMVRAFHAEGLKVFVDVVYNHTGEGGSNHLLSWRGLDTTAYYELGPDKGSFADNNGVGPNFNPHSPAATQLVVDSLRYYADYLGIDGFRFDLASSLGDSCPSYCFTFDKLDRRNALNRAAKELPARPVKGGAGVDLIAEPWAIGQGTYQVGNFPTGWSEWNGLYRDLMRAAQNRVGVADVAPRALAERLLGSRDLYADDGRAPSASINFLVAHDGFTLRDLYAYGSKQNDQPAPYGPSSGGTDDNVSWDHGGDDGEQRKAARTGLLLLALSSGVPMIVGGDELYRTQRGNNNAYNLDNEATWLDWSARSTEAAFFDFARGVLHLRAEHAALRPTAFFDGKDHDGNGLRDVTLLDARGKEATADALDAADRRFLAVRRDGEERGDVARSVYFAYNWSAGDVDVTLPGAGAGRAWHLAALSELGLVFPTGSEPPAASLTLHLAARSAAVLVER
jgi:glycogen operon protein